MKIFIQVSCPECGTTYDPSKETICPSCAGAAEFDNPTDPEIVAELEGRLIIENMLYGTHR